MFGAAWLLCLQLLLVSHVHLHDDEHGGDEATQVCAICLFKTAGQDGAAPLPPGAVVALPLLVELARAFARAEPGAQQAVRAGWQARAPPRAAPGH